jgi:hypothetical protein
MSGRLPNVSGIRSEPNPPPNYLFNLKPLALTALGALSLWVAAIGCRDWGAYRGWWTAKSVSHLTYRSSLLMTTLGTAIGLYCFIKGLADLWQKNQPPKSLPSDRPQNTQLENQNSVPTDRTASPGRQQSQELLNQDTTTQNEPVPAILEHPNQEPGPAVTDFAGVLTTSLNNIESTVVSASSQIITTTPTYYKVPFYVTTIDGSYIGDPARFIDAYPAFKNLTLEDGSPLLLESQDFVVPISFYYDSCPPDVTRLPNPLYLPYNFLKDKATFSLKYKDITLVCTVDQLGAHDKRMRHEFQEILSLVATYVKQNHQVENPLFGAEHDSTWFYKLGNQGSIFKITDKRLEERPSSEFRPKTDPKFAPGKVFLQDGQCYFSCSMPLIRAENVDIILNDTFLMIYARSQINPFPSLSIPAGALVNENTMKDRQGTYEWVFAMSWDQRPEFEQESVATLKEKILEGTLICQSGMLLFSFQLLESSPTKMLFKTLTPVS